MDRASAVALFASEGFFVESVSKDQLHKAWITIQRKYHEGGQNADPQKSQTFNIAYDILKEQPSPKKADQQPDDLPLDEYTVWGWDGEYLIPGFRIECSARGFDNVIKMARGRLRHGFKWPRAILLQPRTASYNPYLLLIYVNGHLVNPPLALQTESDPRVDQHLKSILCRYNT
jgi:hypothetical protein